MSSPSGQRGRARPETRVGRIRASAVATRLGVALRDARRGSNRTQADVAHAAGVSQSLVSEIERGRGAGTSVETWACLAAAVGEQFVAFLERAAGADQPRDIEHLRRQSALIELAASGGWSALPELAIDTGPGRSRSIDVALVRPAVGEAVAVEVWDWFDDVGASLRGLDAKVAALRRHVTSGELGRDDGDAASAHVMRAEARPADGGLATDARHRDWRVAGLFVVRDTRRNRLLVAELRPLFAARFCSSSVAWIRALHASEAPMPHDHGLVWADRHLHLVASRLGRAG